MPIRFRCTACNKLLGIATRKAGTQTTCPQCGETITVPKAGGNNDRLDLDEIDMLLVADPLPPLPKVKSQAAPKPQPPSPPPPPEPKAATPKPTPAAKEPDGEPPLFERGVDEVLRIVNPEPERPLPEKPRPKPTSGMDAGSLGNESLPFGLSRDKATALIVGVAVLLLVAFVAGFLIASR